MYRPNFRLSQLAVAEKKLAQVIAQEKEIKAIADAQLEHEATLITLLEDLYRQRQVSATDRTKSRRFLEGALITLASIGVEDAHAWEAIYSRFFSG